ncbi:hypothetical protein Pla175_05740 [Pirellulimonas nuda]|uniref:YprB ribonuclease H-like domain-containing protein n=1 Tax=Pirellulimonas nuda TaxID=2528009 RepID=A0A518D6W7_9BACT|nr:ribonuclease H-like domain-containing protein [Pirellulimonas nuda]QDU87217.1 hypothetical protein Pla175_05740 [Pirellulimonas nuda]
MQESLRRRLEALNRDRVDGAPAPPPRPVVRDAPLLPATATGLLSTGVVESTPAGEHLSIVVPLGDLWPGGERLVDARRQFLMELDDLAEPFPAWLSAFPARSVLLDLETCGLGGAALFLVGLLREVDHRLVVELLLARNYAEEAAVLHSLWRRLEGAEALVTYNGKSFDWPTVLDRSRRHLLHKSHALACPALHLDVLHPARRKWKNLLPDCRLLTLESRVCRRRRALDIPGARIPAAYDAYVRTGRAEEMEQILHHNALDLVTLLDVTLRVAA